MRWMTVRLFVKVRRAQRRARGAVLATWIRLNGGTVGSRLQVEKHVHLRWRPHAGWVLGDRVYLGVGVILDVASEARLTLGDDVKIMHYCVVAASQSIEIGSQSQVAEHSSIRDSDHGTDRSRPIREQSVASPTVIGSDVWVGRGCAVLRGVRIGDGAVVGANSVVLKDLPELTIAVGAPARVVRHR